jgi:hypothetical protein
LHLALSPSVVPAAASRRFSLPAPTRFASHIGLPPGLARFLDLHLWAALHSAPIRIWPNHCVERTGGSLHARLDCRVRFPLPPVAHAGVRQEIYPKFALGLFLFGGISDCDLRDSAPNSALPLHCVGMTSEIMRPLFAPGSLAQLRSCRCFQALQSPSSYPVCIAYRTASRVGSLSRFASMGSVPFGFNSCLAEPLRRANRRQPPRSV